MMTIKQMMTQMEDGNCELYNLFNDLLMSILSILFQTAVETVSS